MKKLVYLFLIVVVVYGFWVMHRLNWRDGDPDLVTTVAIPEGGSFAAASNLLVEKGILQERDQWLLKFQAKRKDLDTKLAVGNVQVVIGASISDILTAITNAERETFRLTVIEGWDLFDLKNYLEEQNIKGGKDLFDYTGVPGRDYRSEKGQPTKFLDEQFDVLAHKPWYVSMEGYLFPDTYEFFEGATVEDVLKKMLARTNFFIDEGAVNLLRFNSMTVHEALTVASIIEREVRTTDDRRKVVDLILRRRDRNWALQMDSTVNYVTRGDKPAVSIKETKIDSLYNTYKYPGIPLGPIALPSEDSLKATGNPWGNNFNYFLTDLEGNVHYSETLEQHNKKKYTYLK